MTTKADLEETVKSLEALLETERQRPTGHIISGCTIDLSKPDETKIAVANAVEEGMKALQSLGGDSYGIYMGETND